MCLLRIHKLTLYFLHGKFERRRQKEVGKVTGNENNEGMMVWTDILMGFAN